MKKLVISSAGLTFFLLMTSSASADVVVNSEGSKTETEITIIENTETKPFDPKDPNQQNLLLQRVPENYNFQSSVTNLNYSITSNDIIGGDPGIVVFNDLSTREWSVKATVKDDVIYLSTDDTKTFSVDSFEINGNDIRKTGASGIVAKNGTLDSSNTGNMSTPVTSLKINFTDAAGVLKKDDMLKGSIDYVLYNTVDAS